MSDMNKHTHGCGCGNHEHDHEHEHVHTVTLELENGDELECQIIDIFEVEGKEYIALLHPEDDIAMLYTFKEFEDGSIEIADIGSDEDYNVVAEAFNALMEEEIEA